MSMEELEFDFGDSTGGPMEKERKRAKDGIDVDEVIRIKDPKTGLGIATQLTMSYEATYYFKFVWLDGEAKEISRWSYADEGHRVVPEFIYKKLLTRAHAILSKNRETKIKDKGGQNDQVENLSH